MIPYPWQAVGIVRAEITRGGDRSPGVALFVVTSRYQDCRCHNSCPHPVFPNTRLGDVARFDYLVTQFPLVKPLVIALVDIEFDAKDRGQHLRRDVFGVIPGRLVVIPEAVVFREVTEEVPVLGDCNTYEAPMSGDVRWLMHQK